MGCRECGIPDGKVQALEEDLLIARRTIQELRVEVGILQEIRIRTAERAGIDTGDEKEAALRDRPVPGSDRY